MIQTLEVEYNGKKAIVRIEDNLPIGIIDEIMNETVSGDVIDIDFQKGAISGFDLSKIKTNVYTRKIMAAAVVDAPWKVVDGTPYEQEEAYAKVPYKTAEVVLDKVMKIYPPMRFLVSRLEWMTGGKEVTS